MKFISLDIECNQPSGNTIQIGAVAWDTNGTKPVDTFNRFLRPDEVLNWDHMLSCQKTLGDYVGFRLPEYEAGAMDSLTVLVEFKNWLEATQGAKKIVQWGTGDYRQLKKELPMLPMLNPINAQQIYNNLYQPAMRLPKAGGQRAAAAALGIAYVGNPHDALADATVCGEIYLRMFTAFDKLRAVKEALR